MAEVVTESLSKLNDSDIAAIAAYLKSIPAKKSFSDTRPTAAADATPPGAGTYATFCASCHQGDGMGIAGVVPALKGNGAVLAKGPEDVISTVIGGLPAKADYAPMPAIGAGMTDQQVAEAANYVRTAWTNRAPDNAQAGEVADLRKKTTTMLAGADCLPAPAALTDAKSGIGALLSGMTEVNMLNRVGEIVAKAKAAQPQAGKAELVNDLTAAYCPILKQDASVAQDHKPEQLATFSQLVYTRIAQPHERW
jgi:mono/diheme cytochrome c family protein